MPRRNELFRLIFSRLIPVGAAALLACGAGDPEHYEVTGVVEEVASDGRWIKVAHEDIPGFMPAMTMNFDVASPEVVAAAKPGSVVRFDLERTSTSLKILSLEVIGQQPPPAGAPISEGPVDVAPAFALTDHNGAPFRLADVHGKAVLLDFIFTRCPGPCPILTAAHARLQKQLPEAIAERVHFVSISIDPTFDTPEKLTEYATARGADLSRWSFLTGTPDQVDKVVAAYHVGTRTNDAGELDHLVATFLIGPTGAIEERFIGLDHEPTAVLGAIRRALA